MKLIILVVVVVMGCSSHKQAELHSSVRPIEADVLYCLEDDSFSVGPGLRIYKYKREIFAVTYDFPGYANPKWYYISNAPECVYIDYQYILNKNGAAKPKEGGFSKYAYVKGFPRPCLVWYDQETSDVSDCFNKLRNCIVQEKYRVDNIPMWIDNYTGIDKRNGLIKGGWSDK